MQGLIHTTELGRYSSSPARDGLQKFKFHAPAETSPRRAQDPPPSPGPPLPPHSRALPRPRGRGKGPTIYFAILTGFEPTEAASEFISILFFSACGLSGLPCRASYIPLSWAGFASLKPFPLLFRLRPPLPRLVTGSRNLNFTCHKWSRDLTTQGPGPSALPRTPPPTTLPRPSPTQRQKQRPHNLLCN